MPDTFISLTFLDTHHDGQSTEISYQFLPEWWGKGYGYEIVNAIIRYAFNHLGITKLVSETQAANVASCRLLEKLEMTVIDRVTRFGEEQIIFETKSSNKNEPKP
ncbi:GNAT family N-acetyltransferase [Piscibacillus sp. B03]|uniref:GNAT family N-acetyltransferase n=1 Tax=Piscibacillus sp. B03 TaxID=3457430 RepID=UPI003FCD49D7